MDDVLVEGLSFHYGSTAILKDIQLHIPRGSFFTLLGPSGCGKTTLLKLLGGYLQSQSGQIFLHQRDITTLAPEKRNIGMVYQSYALFPHLTAWKNVAFGLEVRGLPSLEIRNRVEMLLNRVKLESAEWTRFPHQLSGGQQQRVAIARALAFNPDLLLLDEPLANLDRNLRQQLQLELRRIHHESGTTTIMVTHDQEEAMAASDQIAVMNAGRILQTGTPMEVYNAPRARFVAEFLGDANLIPGMYLSENPQSLYIIRPEKMEIGGSRQGRVTAVSFRGADILLEIQCDELQWKIRSRQAMSHNIGDIISFEIPRKHCHELSPDDVP